MRIATFNLEDFPGDPTDAAPLGDRIAVLRPQLLRLDADVLCLQEVNAQAPAGGGERGLYALQDLLAGTPYEAFSWASTRQGEPPKLCDKHNLVTLSRWPMRLSEQFANRLVPAPLYHAITAAPGTDAAVHLSWDRPILHAEIGLADGRILHVVNVHLRAPLAVPVPGRKSGPFSWTSVGAWAEGCYMALLKRGGQALEIRLLLERIFDDEADALVLVCGDFNAELSEGPVRIVRGDQEDTGTGALARRALMPLERRTEDGRRFSVLHAGRRVLFDHMLASKPLLAVSGDVEIHNEALEDELVSYASGGRNPASFHAPLVAEFDLAAT